FNPWNLFRVLIAVFLLSSCQPPRSTIITRPLPIKGKSTDVARLEAKDKVLIGIRIDVGQATLAVDGPFNVISIENGAIQELPNGKYDVLVKNGQLTLDGKPQSDKNRVQTSDRDCPLEVSGLRYRGDLIVKKTGNSSFTVINELGIDDYLK